jgi:NHLM bacteriocin system ABC transporter ATP-binding protein
MSSLMDSAGLGGQTRALQGGAVVADLVGSGGYLAVTAGELDVFLVPVSRAEAGANPVTHRLRPLLRLAAGNVAPTIVPSDLPAGWTVRATGVAGTMLRRGRMPELTGTELTGTSPVGEWVRLLSAAAGSSVDGLARRACEPREYPAALRDFHRRALAGAVEQALASDAGVVTWRAARTTANNVTLSDACTVLTAAAAGKLTEPGRPRTEAERAIAVTGLLGSTVALSVTAIAEAEDPMDAALTAAGMRYRPVRLESAWWRTAAVPLVARYADGDTVALIPRKGRYLIADQALAARKPVDAELAGQFSDRAWQVYPPLSAAGTVTELIRCALAGAGRSLRMIAAAGLAAAVLGVAVPLISAAMVTNGLSGAGHVARFTWFAILIAAAVIGSALFTVVRNSLVVRLEGHIQTTLEPAVWARLLSLDVGFFAKYSTGDLVQRANSVAAMRRAVGDVAIGSLLGAVFSSLSMVALFLVDPRLAAIVIAGVVVALVLMARLAVRQQRHEIVTFDLYGRIYSLLYAFLLGIDKLQVAGREVQAFGMWARLFSRQRAGEAKSLHERTASAALAVGTQPMLMLLLVVGASWIDPGVTTGAFLAAVVALGQFGLAIGQWHRAVESAFSLLPRFERMKPLLVAEPEIDPRAKPPGTLSGKVELKNLSFAYEGTATQIFDDLNVSFRPGEFAAIVGPSGVGKSTLVRLLLGFERPRIGQVLYDGRDLRDIDVRQVRRQVGVVMQQARVLRGSVLENITGAIPGLTEDDAWHAAELAGLDEDIRRMPMGMHTTVGEDNGSFSGGQLQRLLIARALVRRPRIIMLDEATSALDNVTQALVSERIADLDATRIVIAHRLSTIRQADRIHVIEGGRVTGSGNFAELVDGHQFFARLVARQEV